VSADPTIRIRLGGSHQWRDRFHYRIAGFAVVTDAALDVLAPFTAPARARSCPCPPLPRPDVPEREVYHGPGFIGGRLRTVRCVHVGTAYRIDLPAIARLLVAADGSAVEVLEAPLAVGSNLLVEAVLGPGLILALGLNGTFCLHASAVAVPEGVVAFLGESGRGKSTLAQALDQLPNSGCRRVADDVLPVRLDATGALALPHFPQLKMQPTLQYPPRFPDRLPLTELVVLAPLAAPEASPQAESLGPHASVLALLRHTVASRLFPPELAADHLEWCSSLTRRTETSRIALPSSLRRLAEAPGWLRTR
jgi:hypothetical protein